MWKEIEQCQEKKALISLHVFDWHLCYMIRYTVFNLQYTIYPKYWDILTTYHMATKIFIKSPFCYLSICINYCQMSGKQCRPCLNYCQMSGKQCRPWLDAAECSGPTLFVQACLSQYLGLLWYSDTHVWAKSVDPDQMPQNATSDQGRHCHTHICKQYFRNINR